MKIWHMRIACWTLKVTNIHLQYVIIFAFLLQRLHERASLLRCTYIACLVISYTATAGQNTEMRAAVQCELEDSILAAGRNYADLKVFCSRHCGQLCAELPTQESLRHRDLLVKSTQTVGVVVVIDKYSGGVRVVCLATLTEDFRGSPQCCRGYFSIVTLTSLDCFRFLSGLMSTSHPITGSNVCYMHFVAKYKPRSRSTVTLGCFDLLKAESPKLQFFWDVLQWRPASSLCRFEGTRPAARCHMHEDLKLEELSGQFMIKSRNLIGTCRLLWGVWYGRQNTVMGWACSWVEENRGGVFCWKAPVSKAKVNVVRVDLRLASCRDRRVLDLAQVCLVLKVKAPRPPETSRTIGTMTQRHIP
jgi:hypothetical protein